MIDSCIQGLSPAADAGIRAGDLITKWGDAEIQSHAMFRSFVAKSKINEPVRVTLERHGSEETLTVTVKVGSKPLQFR